MLVLFSKYKIYHSGFYRHDLCLGLMAQAIACFKPSQVDFLSENFTVSSFCVHLFDISDDFLESILESEIHVGNFYIFVNCRMGKIFKRLIL